MRALFALCVLVPAVIEGQSVRGVVADVRNSDRLNGAALLLTDSTGSIVGATASDSTGAFLLRAMSSGMHVLLISRNGYHLTESDSLALEPGQVLELRINLVPLPRFELDPIEVIANDQPRNVEFRDFLRRRELNIGQSFDLVDIERIQPFDLDDILRMVPGAIPQGRGLNTWMALNSNRCRPGVAVDGRRVDPQIVADFPMDWIIAVEVYRRVGEVPGAYRNVVGRGSFFRDCGAVLVWTRSMR